MPTLLIPTITLVIVSTTIPLVTTVNKKKRQNQAVEKGWSLTSDSLSRLSFCLMYFWMNDAGMLPSLT
jgi:hypothetical protein